MLLQRHRLNSSVQMEAVSVSEALYLSARLHGV